MPLPSPPPNPWRTTSSRVVYANDWIRVRDERVLRADGRPGVYGVVAFRQRALGAVPLFPDGTTVLVGQWRYPLEAYSWEIPEGGGELDADPRAEMARELQEETGLSAATWTPLGEVHPSNSVTDQRGRLWLAEDLEQGEAAPEGTEELLVHRLPLVEAHALALRGDLTDALTVVGLCRAVALLAARG